MFTVNSHSDFGCAAVSNHFAYCDCGSVLIAKCSTLQLTSCLLSYLFVLVQFVCFFIAVMKTITAKVQPRSFLSLFILYCLFFFLLN